MPQVLRPEDIKRVRRRLGRVKRGARRRLDYAKRRLQQRTTTAPTTPQGDRLVPSPVFVISSVRSGSTLLRVILNTHSKLHSPHELHLRTMRVQLEKDYTHRAVRELDLDVDELEHLLWDRILHRELQRSGKQMVVEKTPGNAKVWQRLRQAWPQGRYIFLLRHPASMVNSLISGRPDRDYDKTVREVYGYIKAVEEARKELSGLTVWYEELTAEPERITREICEFLGVSWEQQMLEYGRQEHGPFRGGIGDWSKNIKSGKIQEAKPLPEPEEVPDLLREIARSWGYRA